MGARAAISSCHPEPVIEEFARFSSLGGITRGEQGLVVSMNLRWLPHCLRQRQALGLEPVRYNFAPTSHDPLAQSPGTFTWHFDAGHQVWQTLGAEETGASPFVLPRGMEASPGAGKSGFAGESCRTGIESDQAIQFTLGPVMRNGALPPGEYRLRLLLLDPMSSAPGQNVFTVSVCEAQDTPKAQTRPASQDRAADQWVLRDRVDIFKDVGQPCGLLERVYPVMLGASGQVGVKLVPIQGKAFVSEAVLESAR
jgi:hypothetical protein